MRSRNTNVRSKVVALLLSLVALWAFAAYVTVRDGLNLLWVSVAYEDIGTPLDNLVAALSDERALAVKAAAGDRSAAQDLARAEKVTDDKVGLLWTSADSAAVDWAASDTTKKHLADLRTQLVILGELRNRVDAHASDILDTITPYNAIIDSAFLINRSLASFDDKNIATQSRAVVNVVYAHEIVRREDALMSAIFAAGTITGPQRAEFGDYVGTRRFLHNEEVTDLDGAAKTELESFQKSQQYTQFANLESSVIAASSGTGVTEATWHGVVTNLADPLQKFESTAVDTTLASAESAAIGTIVRLVLAGLLGLAAVITSIIISITTARNLVRQLERLRNAARDLASYRLPRVVERLQQGEQVDVAQEAPPLDFGRDEIGQVGQAFNQVQETAIRVAVEQAELRRSVRDVFLSLARRSQALLHRQLGLLDAMERRSTDSEELAELFRIDHLATRMRRNAENLIVLSGATAGRAWRKPVPMVDVLRGALAEVEDYTRVTVLPVGNASLLGRAVGDVIHLLAELIENAVSFSPPQTTVRVGGSLVGYGFAIEIEDRGLGMSQEELAAANEQLRDPPEFRLTSTARLGLYVVGTLAKRHSIRVRLTESPYGGTTAVILLPGSIMAEEGTEDTPLDMSQLDSFRPAQLTGGGRHRLQTDADRGRSAVAVAASPNGTADGHVSAVETELRTPKGAGAVAASGALTTTAQTADEPAAGPPAEPKLTPSGLPWRQRGGDRQSAEVEPPTMAFPAPAAAGAPVEAAIGNGQRDPGMTRSKIASYRSGTLRGRNDAARLTTEAPPALPLSDAPPTTPAAGDPAPPADAVPMAGTIAPEASDGAPTVPSPVLSAPTTPAWTLSTPGNTPPGAENATPAPPWPAAVESPPRMSDPAEPTERNIGQLQDSPWTTSTPEMRNTEEGG